jgi:DNA primase
MALIPEEEIQQVKQTTDLVAYLRGRGVEMKRKGKQYVGLCPFHDDHAPSLIVDPKKQLWNCLGACGEGGDVYRLVMKWDGVDFRAAHDALSSRFKVQGSQSEDQAQSRVQELVWLDKYVGYCHQRFLERPAAQDYARSRGIVDMEGWRVFRLGYADGACWTSSPWKGVKC